MWARMRRRGDQSVRQAAIEFNAMCEAPVNIEQSGRTFGLMPRRVEEPVCCTATAGCHLVRGRRHSLSTTSQMAQVY
jgi:hypothetical protein